MGLLCTTTTKWIEQEVLEPVTTWVQQQRKECSGKWWNPFCWFVWILVPVVVWVVRNIVVPVMETICTVVTGLLCLIFRPFVAAWPAGNAWVRAWLCTWRCEVVSEMPSATIPGQFDYLIRCRRNGQTFTITAPNIEMAVELARPDCAKVCQ